MFVLQRLDPPVGATVRTTSAYRPDGTEWAWRMLRERLCERLVMLPSGDELRLEVAAAEDERRGTPYVSVRREGDLLLAETPGDRSLGEAHRIGEGGRRRLCALGWRRVKGDQCYRSAASGRYVDQVAHLCVASLRDAHQVIHPAFLRGDVELPEDPTLPRAAATEPKQPLVDDRIQCVRDLDAWPFAPAHLRTALTQMCATCSRIDGEVAERVGGRVFLAPKDEVGPLPPVLDLLLSDDAVLGRPRAELVSKVCDDDPVQLRRWLRRAHGEQQAAAERLQAVALGSAPGRLHKRKRKREREVEACARRYQRLTRALRYALRRSESEGG